MVNQPFLSKVINRIERIDKQSLAQWILGTINEKQFFNNILNALDEGIMVVNKKFRLCFINRFANHLLGNPDIQHLDAPLEKVIEDSGFRSLIKKTIEEKSEIYGESIEIFAPRYLKLNVTITQLLNENGESKTEPGYLIFFTIETKFEEQNKEKHQLERLSSILSLAAGIAHEIGNPLNSINVHLQLLSRDITKLPKLKRNPIKKSLDVVVEETKRLDAIVRNFLRATRRKPVQFQLGNIHEIIRDVLTLFEPEFAVNDIQTVTHFDSAIPPFFIDRERINQAFVNLIKNAIQAMNRRGKITITTSLRKNACEIAISDTGVGINRETLPRLFDAYYTTKEEGTGLGLVIAYQIIREHSGRIEISSKLGKGTTVEILLPIRKEKLQLINQKANPKEKNISHEQFI